MAPPSHSRRTDLGAAQGRERHLLPGEGSRQEAPRLGLADRTRQDYAKLIKQIVAEFGEMPIAALSGPPTGASFSEAVNTGGCAGGRGVSTLLKTLSWPALAA